MTFAFGLKEKLLTLFLAEFAYGPHLPVPIARKRMLQSAGALIRSQMCAKHCVFIYLFQIILR